MNWSIAGIIALAIIGAETIGFTIGYLGSKLIDTIKERKKKKN